MKKGYTKAALFLASQAVTLLGSSIVQFAIIWYVTLEISSGGWVALLSAAAYIPQFLISFFAGVWADCYPRKRLIIAADSAINKGIIQHYRTKNTVCWVTKPGRRYF